MSDLINRFESHTKRAKAVGQRFPRTAALAAALAVGVGSAAAVPTLTISVPTANATVSGKDSAAPARDKTYSLTWHSTGAALGAHTVTVEDGSGSASSSNTVYVRLQFNVRKYGARGNGVADDTEAIRSALAAAKNAGGGTVYFPQGTYIIYPFYPQQFYVGSNIEFRGDGRVLSILKVGDGNGDYAFIFGQTGSVVISNLSFRHLRFDQNPTGNATPTMIAQNVIQLYRVNNIEVDDVSFDPEPASRQFSWPERVPAE